MKRKHLLALFGLLAIGSFILIKLMAAEGTTFQVAEYGTLRWQGREHSVFIRPNGSIDQLGTMFMKLKRPERVDERTFYMNLAINAIAREGFEVANVDGDQILMKRQLPK